MRLALCLAIGAAAFGLGGSGLAIQTASASAETRAETGPLIDLEVTEAPLKTVIQLLMRDSGVNIVLAGDVMDMPVTASIKRRPLETVLRQVLAGSGVNFVKDQDGTYLIGSNVDLSIGAAPAPLQDIRPVALDTESLNQAPVQPRRTRTEKIPLQFLNPKQAMVMLGALDARVAADPSARPRGWYGGDLNVFEGQFRPKVDITYVDPPTSIPTGSRGSNININVPPSVPTSDYLSPDVANRTVNDNITANQVTTRPGNRPVTPTQATGRSDTPRSVTSTGTAGTDDIRPDGLDAIIPVETENALLVKGEDDAVQELKDLITLLDVPPKQVIIKAEFVEVSTNFTQRLGMDWMLSRPNYIVQTDFRPSGNVLAYVQSGNLTANLRAELTQGGGKVVNAPIISTLNNTAANISIGRQIPFYQSITQVPDNGIPITTSQVVYIDASTELQVLPQINGDNSITLIMQPRVSDSSGFVTGPNGEEAPIISQQTLSTARRVANGETIVVGGFIKKNDTSGGTKVPILGDLPIIGGLFRSSSNTKQDTETLIFITPTVIDEVGSSQAIGVGINP